MKTPQPNNSDVTYINWRIVDEPTGTVDVGVDRTLATNVPNGVLIRQGEGLCFIPDVWLGKFAGRWGLAPMEEKNDSSR